MSEITTKRPKSTEHVLVPSGRSIFAIKREFPRLHGLCMHLAESRTYSFDELLAAYLDRLRDPHLATLKHVGHAGAFRAAAAAARNEFLALLDRDVEARKEALETWLARARRELDRTDPREARAVELAEIAVVVENLLDFAEA